jgi:hypothetical protein
MQAVFLRLQRENVTISYQTNGTGLVGQAWEGSADPGNPQFTLPMNVTVSITGMTHQFYFISALLLFLVVVSMQHRQYPRSRQHYKVKTCLRLAE